MTSKKFKLCMTILSLFIQHTTITLSVNQTSEHTSLLKSVEMHNKYQSLITLASLGEKGQSPHGKENHPSTLKDFGDKSLYSIVDVNSKISSYFGSPTRRSKGNNFSNHSDSFTSSFSVTMLVMTTYATFVKKKKKIVWDGSCHH